MGTSSTFEDLRVWQRAGPGSDSTWRGRARHLVSGVLHDGPQKKVVGSFGLQKQTRQRVQKTWDTVVAAPAPGNFKSTFKGGTVPLPPSSRELKHPRPSRPLYLPWPLVSACFPKKKTLRSPPCSCCSACLCSSAS